MSGFYYSLDSRHILCHNSSCWRGFYRTKSHMITLHTCGFYRPQNNKPHDHIAHMRIQQTTEPQAIDHIAHMRIQQTTEPQATLSHYTHVGYTDHRPTSHIITLHTGGFYRPQTNKPHYHITHMWVIQTTDQQATLSHYTHMSYTDHRPTSHIITLHTCGFYRPQTNKPHYHITHI